MKIETFKNFDWLAVVFYPLAVILDGSLLGLTLVKLDWRVAVF